jgi:hypothetical protein
MIASIDFNLENPDDERAFQRCACSLDMAIVLFEIKHNLFRGLPDSDESELIQSRIQDLFTEHNICLEKIIE